MNSKKKVLLTLISTIALVVASVLGTIAYLTDSATVTNIFTVGNVDIKLEETKVDNDGNPLEDDLGNPTGELTEEGNIYHLMPGEEYTKDPTLTVLANSEDSYVRMILTVYNATAVQAIVDNPEHKLVDYSGLFSGWDNTKWNYVGFTKDDVKDTISFEFRYHTVVDKATEDTKLEPLFTKLVAPSTLTNIELQALYGDGSTTEDDFKLEVVGHAIQKATFETADEAWEAFAPTK